MLRLRRVDVQQADPLVHAIEVDDEGIAVDDADHGADLAVGCFGAARQRGYERGGHEECDAPQHLVPAHASTVFSTIHCVMRGYTQKV